MVAPPFDAGAVNESAAWPLPGTAVVMVGAPGGVMTGPPRTVPDAPAKLVGLFVPVIRRIVCWLMACKKR